MSERGGFNSEQDRVYGRLQSFFGEAERRWPQAAGQLVDAIGGLVGKQQTTEKQLREGMGNIDVGLALIGDWLKEIGAPGFEVKLGFGGGAKKAIGRSQVNFPRIDSKFQDQTGPLLASFSRQIQEGLESGLSPRRIIGGLVSESIGDKLSVAGSASLRRVLEKPLGGHFELLREVLGVPDVTRKSGFKPMVKAESKQAAVVRMEGQKGKPAETNLISNEKVFMDTLEDLFRMENSTGPIDLKTMRQHFQKMKLYFSKLPSDGQLRADVMKDVVRQLKTDGEKIKSGEPEAEIFDKWLRRIFIPFYKRTKK